MNEAAQPANSNLIILSEQSTRKLPFSYFKLKVLSFLRFLKLLPFAKLLHPLPTRDYSQILEVIVIEASIDELYKFLVSAC